MATSKFIDRLRLLAEQKDLEATFSLGLCYEFGFISGTPELGEAFKLYLEAARLGHTFAQITVARYYRDGIVVRKNEEKLAGFLDAAASRKVFSAGFIKQSVDDKKLIDKESDKPVDVPKAANPSGQPQKKIMVVDDSKTIRLFIHGFLVEQGYAVELAEDGLEGLQKLQKANDVDLILTDINMPKLDGLGMTRQLRQIGKYAKTPIVMLTTQSDKETVMTARKIGINGWLVKPPNPEHITALLAKVLGKK